MSIAGQSPWRTVEHDGERYMVRQNDSATWIVRSAGTCIHCKAWLWHRSVCFTCGRGQAI